MGAGIAWADWRKKLYRKLKRIEAKLVAAGFDAKYGDLQVAGDGFQVYHRTLGPASNGERAALLQVVGERAGDVKKVLGI